MVGKEPWFGDESGNEGVTCVKVVVDTDQAWVLHLFQRFPLY